MTRQPTARPRGPFAVAAVLAISACSATEPGELQVVGGSVSPAASSILNVSADEPVSVGLIRLCVEGADQITITSVAPRQPTGGLTVRDFAIRTVPASPPGDAAFGEHKGSLGSLGVADLPRVVSTRCGAEVTSGATLSEAIIEFARTGDDVGDSQGLEFTYGEPGSHEPLFVPFRTVLCPTGQAAHPLCD